jgi:O-antigen/teichoic acid export membrane protein
MKSAPTTERRAGDETRDEIRQLASGSGLNLVGMMLYQAVLFLVMFILARRSGGQAVGLYSQAIALMALLELFALGGFRDGLTRFVALHRADDDPASLRGTVRLGLGISMAVAVVIAGALFAAAGWLAGSVFDDPGLAGPLRFVAAGLPSLVFLEAALSAGQGFRTQRYRAGIGLIGVSVVRIALTVGLLAIGTGLAGVMAALLIANTLGAIAAGVALRRQMGRPTEAPRYRPRELLRFSTVSWTASIANTGLIWIDSILLGIYEPSSQVGVYQVATRLVMFATLAMIPVNAAFAPQITDLHRRGRTDSLRRTYQAATSWILRLSLPTFAVLVAFPGETLGLFGPAFAAGAAVTVILVIGKLVDATTGPCGVMLNGAGRPGLNLVNNVGVLILNIVLNIVLIPRHGIVGSAIAWTSSLVLVNIARVVQVKVTMGMLPIDRGALKGLADGGVAFLAGLGVRQVLSGTTALLVGAGVVTSVYLVVLVALGLPREDRVVLADLRRRRRPSVNDGPQRKAA